MPATARSLRVALAAMVLVTFAASPSSGTTVVPQDLPCIQVFPSAPPVVIDPSEPRYEFEIAPPVPPGIEVTLRIDSNRDIKGTWSQDRVAFALPEELPRDRAVHYSLRAAGHPRLCSSETRTDLQFVLSALTPDQVRHGSFALRAEFFRAASSAFLYSIFEVGNDDPPPVTDVESLKALCYSVFPSETPCLLLGDNPEEDPEDTPDEDISEGDPAPSSLDGSEMVVSQFPLEELLNVNRPRRCREIATSTYGKFTGSFSTQGPADFLALTDKRATSDSRQSGSPAIRLLAQLTVSGPARNGDVNSKGNVGFRYGPLQIPAGKTVEIVPTLTFHIYYKLNAYGQGLGPDFLGHGDGLAEVTVDSYSRVDGTGSAQYSGNLYRQAVEASSGDILPGADSRSGHGSKSDVLPPVRIKSGQTFSALVTGKAHAHAHAFLAGGAHATSDVYNTDGSSPDIWNLRLETTRVRWRITNPKFAWTSWPSGVSCSQWL